MNLLRHPWVLIAAGTGFCIAGIISFRKNIFEEDRSVNWSLLLIAMGIILIAMGSAGAISQKR